MTTTKTETALVPFHGQHIPTFRDGEAVSVAMKPICDAIGLDWASQRKRINRHPVLSATMVMMTIVGADGKRREMATLPIQYLNGWLFGVETSRAKPETREALITYQRECFQVLADYWQRGAAINPRQRAAVGGFVTLSRHSLSLLRQLKQETAPPARRLIHQQLHMVCQQLGVDTPPLETIGREAPPVPPLVDEFWAAFDYLTNERGVALDHASDPRLIAVNLIQFDREARAAGLKLPPRAAFMRVLKESKNPRFIESNRSVRSCLRDSRVVRCWVFAVIEKAE